MLSRFRSSFASLPPTLLSFLGHRLSRTQILRIALLLLTQLFLTSLSLPPSFSALLSTLLSTTLHTTLILATTATFFDFTGILGSLFTKWFAADRPFLEIFGIIVLVAGPLGYVGEAVVVAYEVIRVVRKWEFVMYEAQNRGGGDNHRRALLFLGVSCMLAVGGVVFLLWNACALIAAALCLLCAGVLTIGVWRDDANVIESSVMCLYMCICLLLGLVEEVDIPTPFLSYYLPNYNPTLVKTLSAPFWQHVRALVFMYSIAALIMSLTRGKRFFRLVTVGFEQLQREEQSQDVGKWGWGEISLILACFRVLVWLGHVRVGEYIPLLCRLVQAVVGGGSYAIFVLGK